MKTKIYSDKEKILQYLDFKGEKKSDFYRKTGFSNGFLDSGSSFSVQNLRVILGIYRDLSFEWLISDQGDMLFAPAEVKNTESLNKPVNKMIGIPLLTESAFAGLTSGDVSILELDCERFVIPSFKGADFLITVKGSSMTPKYSSGDIVACKWLPLDTFFQWNKVYVIDTIQGPLIKRICEGKDIDHLKIVSENEKYPPYNLHKSEIRKLAIVIGVIRLE